MEKKLFTKRMILREIIESDADDIVRWRSSEAVYKYFKAPHKISIDEHLNWFRNSYTENGNRIDWICIEKTLGRKLGVVGLSRIGVDVEVSYILAPEAQHCGYAAEAVERLTLYAAEVWKAKKMVAEIHQDNLPSLHLACKLGFRKIDENKPFLIFAKDIK